MKKQYIDIIRKVKNLTLLSVGMFLMAGLISSVPLPGNPLVGTASAACLATAPPTTYGQVQQTVNVPASGTYRVWSRIKAPDTTANSYYFQVDNGCAYNVGDSASIPANTWTWVNYQDANSTSHIDLALTAGSHQLTYTGKEANVQLDRVLLLVDTSCVPTGTGDNCAVVDTTAPTVSLSAPTSGQTVSGTTTISAGASDASGISKVDFLVDGVVKGTDTTSAYTYAWDTKTVGNGFHTINARATDTAGNTATSAAITVTVSNSTSTSVTINDTTTGTGLNQFNYTGTGWLVSTTPAPNAYQADNHNSSVSGASYTLQFSGTQIKVYSEKSPGIGITAYSIDGGAETMVDGYAATRADQQMVYSSLLLTSGTHTLKARDTGTKNASATSAYIVADRVDITPLVADTTAPTVSITAPAAGSSSAVGTTITINANASDNVGVSKVDFQVDGVTKNTDTTSPYSYAWNTTGIAVGTHTLSAKAYDAAGNVTTSGTVSISLTSATNSSGDTNGDGRVNAIDLSALISHDGQNYPAADFNGDGTVGSADMAILLSKWTW